MEHNKEYYVYRHIRLDNNQVFYVGIGTKQAEYNCHRAEYLRAYNTYNRSTFWSRVYYKTAIRVEIIFESTNYEEILLKEQEFIKLYGRRNLLQGTLVNMTDGGEGALGNVMSEESKLKISIANTGRVRTEEVKQRLREFNTGKKHSQEHKNNISKGGMGKEISQETRDKISASNKGKVRSDETKEKIKNNNIERFKNPEARKKARHGSHGTYLDLHTGIFYEYLRDACDANNYCYIKAQNMLRTKSKNIRFMRVNDGVENLTKTK